MIFLVSPAAETVPSCCADGNPAPVVLVAASEWLTPSTGNNERGPSGVQDRREHTPKRYSKCLEETVVWTVELHGGLTNNYGEFEIEGLELRTYALSGEREDWYPSARLSLIDGKSSRHHADEQQPFRARDSEVRAQKVGCERFREGQRDGSCR